MSLVLDAGALVTVERAQRQTVALIKHELLAGRAPVTHGGVVGQVWRGGSGRQANLARLLPGLDIVSLDAALGRRAGVLLGRARMTDIAGQPAFGPAPFERRDCRRRDRRQEANRARNVTAAQLTALRGSRKARWRARFSTTSDRSAGSTGAGPDAFTGEIVFICSQ